MKETIKSQLSQWLEPLDLAYQISTSDYKENWVFLYSGLHKQIKNSKSYLCLYPQKEIIADGFADLEKDLSKQYFGYLGYDLKNQLENLENGQKSFIDLPNLWMIYFGLVLEFDHDKKIITEFSLPSLKFSILTSQSPAPSSRQKSGSISSFIDPDFCRDDGFILDSNFTKSEYLQKVKTIQTHIENGDIYQANLTRKFFGKFQTKPKNSFEIFLKLNQKSPANYSSFLKLGENYIISSSPELFLKIDEQGKVLSSPIKGTAKRFSDKKLDKKSKQDLKNSP